MIDLVTVALGGPPGLFDPSLADVVDNWPTFDPTAILETFVGGTPGQLYTVSSGQLSGGAGGTTGQWTYANTPAWSGKYGYGTTCTMISGQAGSMTRYISVPGGANRLLVVGSFSFSAIPTASMPIFAVRTGTGTIRGQLAINTSGNLTVRNANQVAQFTSTTVLNLGVPYTAVWLVDESAGTQQVTLYDQYGNLVEASANVSVGAQGTVDNVQFGMVSNPGPSTTLTFGQVGFQALAPTVTPLAQPQAPRVEFQPPPFLMPWSVPTFQVDAPPAEPFGIADADLGAAVEAALLSATLPAADTGAGADAAALSVSEAAADTGSGADAGLLTATLPGADTGSGADAGAASASGTGADTGTGAEAVSETATLSPAETGVGTDTGAVVASGGVADAGSGTDVAVETATLPSADTGVGADAALLAARLVAADVGLGTEAALVAQLLHDTDTGSGADAALVTVRITDTDTGQSVDIGFLRYTQPADIGMTLVSITWTQPIDQGVTQPQ